MKTATYDKWHITGVWDTSIWLIRLIKSLNCIKALAIQLGSPQCFTLSAWQRGALCLVEKWEEVSLGSCSARRASPPAGTSASLNAIDYLMQAKAKFAALIINPTADPLLNNTPPFHFFPLPSHFWHLLKLTGARAKWGLSDGTFADQDFSHVGGGVYHHLTRASHIHNASWHGEKIPTEINNSWQ